MTNDIDLRQVRFYLENARAQVRNVFSKKGTNARDSIRECLEEALKELRRAEPVPATQESAVPAL
ncbi:MAG TPA: hypothetical protein VG269_11055 [Tepidisphaeraceae bacterium]|jgi:hypothetical protein|nr:hypothetical protein [Tepidisphaeraceae bacterium]